MDSYGFVVDHTYLSRDAPFTVVGTLSGKEEMLEGTSEHDTSREGLALPDFILGNSKTTYIFSGLAKEAFSGVW